MWKDKEIESLLIQGIVQEILQSRHILLLKELGEEAKALIAALPAQRQRHICAIKIQHPEMSLISLVKEVS